MKAGHYLAAACAALALPVAACAPMAAAPEAAAGPAPAPASPSGEAVAQGRFLAETNCATCHAVGRAGDSPRPDAPPLRRVLAQYQAESLELDFQRGLRVGHPDMPRFRFEPEAINALLAYLSSIQDWDMASADPAPAAGTARSGR